ncbi:VOC family protein [Bacillus massiliglaciei]|uniref:VOC family protein n=1 Tax=Bacillus massiliglaciei TaxID=1816693 RepID=UPI000DA61D92|nr:glyoxalase [Bacillus massiliglaciei]
MEMRRVTVETDCFSEQKKFYKDTLGAPTKEETDSQFTVLIGSSELSFIKTEPNRKPFYHFAFNIPANQFDEAKSWLQNKTLLNTEDGKDEHYFTHINASSIYFSDPGGNIGEFICYHSLSPVNHQLFSMKSLLNLSEMSVTASDVRKAEQTLTGSGIGKEGYDTEELTFLGKGKVFLLLALEGRRWFFSDKKAEPHPAVIELSTGQMVIQDGRGNILVK